MIMMKRIPLFLLGSALTLAVHATNPLQRSYQVRQPDGTTLIVTRHLAGVAGGERFVYYTTTDGSFLLQNPQTGAYTYATLDADGLPCPTEILAHEPAHRTADELRLSQNATGLLSAMMNRSMSTLPAQRSRALTTQTGITPYGETAGGILKSIGAPTIPVIMVEFPDLSFQETTTQEKVTRWLNDPEYADEQYTQGSAGSWFADQSKGLFRPKFEVVATVKVANGYAYYGANASSGSIDQNCSSMVSEAIKLAAEQGVDFSKYKDNDLNAVPLVSIYHAGPGEHSSYEAGHENYLWAHFKPMSTTVNGTTVRSYFVGNELLRSYKRGEDGNPVPVSAQNDGIGVFIHELGHALGLPDFYSTNDNDAITPGYWSVMDYGQYTYDGYRPMGYSAYERAMLGWQKVVELNEPGFYRLIALDKEPAEGTETPEATAYVLRSASNEKEFFMLENRQPSTWFPSFFGTGMLITHVNFDRNYWVSNCVNNDMNLQRYEIVPADGTKQTPYERDNGWVGHKGDLWGATTAMDFTDESTPAATLSDGSPLGKPIYGIKQEADASITFAFMDQTLTGVEPITPSASTAAPIFYDMNGRRVLRPTQPGVYIQHQPGQHAHRILVK